MPIKRSLKHAVVLLNIHADVVNPFVVFQQSEGKKIAMENRQMENSVLCIEIF